MLPTTAKVGIGFSLVLAIVGIVMLWTSVYRVDATEVAVFQMPVSGTLAVETVPGTYGRFWASVSRYRKQDNYEFEWDKAADKNHSISVQFNDGGKASVGGNVQWEMPLDQPTVIALHTLYGSQQGIDYALIRNSINRAMTFTAPLMSATESYAVRRADFLQIFADQLENGIYQMQSTDIRQADPITGDMKTVKLVSIVRDQKTGQPVRAEESPLKKYGIKIQPPSITHIVYEEKVEQQIQQQRDNILAIQTAQAEAKKAEQSAITAVKNGEAQAAKAKWDQEVKKATEVTLAEQNKAVAELNATRDKSVAEVAAQRDLAVQTFKAQTAEQYKLEQIRMGEGDAGRRQAVMLADGALTQKLDAWVKSQEYWAAAFAKYQGEVVPRIVSGGDGRTTNAASDFMSVMGMKAASDLALDMRIVAPKLK